jgi:hypothetical protein
LNKDIMFEKDEWQSLRDRILWAALKAKAEEMLTLEEAKLLADAAETWVAMVRPMLG